MHTFVHKAQFAAPPADSLYTKLKLMALQC